jgi:hypothetical protein
MGQIPATCFLLPLLLFAAFLCRRFLQFAFHFRDSMAIQPNAGQTLPVIAARLADPIVSLPLYQFTGDTIMARILAEKTESSLRQVIHFAGVRRLATHNR